MSRDSIGRLFLAVPVTGEFRAALQAHLHEARRGAPLPGRVVRPESWHLTLQFLGETPAEARDRLRRELEAAALGQPFTLEFGSCGAFPRAARASVLWLGIAEGATPLRALAAAVQGAAQRAGWEPEKRPFSPHLTLGRLQPPQDVRALLEQIPPFPHRLKVEQVVLYRSHLGRGGARYEAIERFELTE